MQSSDMGWIRTNLDFPILWAFPESLFRARGVLASFQVFINVYKHYGSTEKTYWIQGLDPRSKILGKTSWIQGLDPRSKILGKTSWIQGLDPRSKIQDSRKNSLDPRSGSKIQDPRFQEKLLGSEDKAFPDPRLGSTVDPRSFSWNLGSWIQTLDPRSFS